LTLELCNFFFLLGYFKCRLVKLTWVKSSCFSIVFLFNLLLFWQLFYLSYFVLSRSHIMGCRLVKLARVNSGFFLRHYFFFKLIFLFHHLILDFWILIFVVLLLFFFYIELSQFYILNCIIIKLIQVSLSYYYLNIFFIFKKFNSI